MRGLTLLPVLLLWLSPVAAETARSGFNVVQGEDGGRSYIFTYAIESEGPGREVEPALAWSCDEDGLNVFHIFGRYLVGDDDRAVRVRYAFEDAPDEGGFVEYSHWTLTSNSRSAWMLLEAVRPFTEEALAHETVVLQVIDPSDEEALSDRFELQALADALAHLPCY